MLALVLYVWIYSCGDVVCGSNMMLNLFLLHVSCRFMSSLTSLFRTVNVNKKKRHLYRPAATAFLFWDFY